ncbi:MAG TPA: efflux RND transporter periplasmic adaptor subunit [Victivallales bacterium]|nr:efflux RND transporter periplasmic adaptor subunit [Victivallales bacterium]
MHLKKIITTIFLIIICISFIVLSVSCSKKESTGGQFKIKRAVQIGKAISYDVPIYVKNIGSLTSVKSVNIISQVTGEIIKCYFKQGQYVKKGDLLFTIDPRLYQALLDRAYASLKQDQADEKLQEYIVNKDRNLPKTGAIAKQAFAQYITTLKKTIAKVELDKANIEEYAIQLSYCRIASPIDGITGFRKVDPGNVVTANNGPTLVNIRSIDPLYVDFTIPERNLTRLKHAMSKGELKVIIETQTANLEDKMESCYYEGVLKVLSNAVDNKTGTILLRAVVPNKDRLLWPGQFVNVKLIFFVKKNALLVPYQSVSQGQKGYYVFLVKNNKAVLEYVKPGLKEEGYIEITPSKENAIKPGDTVVTVGQMGLAPGSDVKIVKTATFKLPLLSKTNTDTQRSEK